MAPWGSRHEPAARYAAPMDHLYLWRYSHPAGGRRVMLDHFTEAEALRLSFRVIENP